MYIYLFTAASPLTYTIEFRELFEATAYLQDCILLDGAGLTLLIACKHCTYCKQTTLDFGQELVGIVINILSIMS
jgi:Fe-S cluster assembly iron-binding protein IscA